VVVVGDGTMESREVSQCITTVQSDRLTLLHKLYPRATRVVAGLSECKQPVNRRGMIED